MSNVVRTLSIIIPIGFLLAVVFADPGTVQGSCLLEVTLDGDQKDEPARVPDPARALREAVRKLDEHSRKQGYEIDCKVRGGLSNKGDHGVWMHVVYEQHKGVVRGDLMFVQEMLLIDGRSFDPVTTQVYRNPRKGAILVDDQWVPLKSSPAGNRLDRILHFPSELFEDAVLRSRTARWIEPRVEVDLNDPDYVDPMDPLEEPEGGTAVAKKPAQVSTYQRVKVDVDEKVAVQYFNDVQKSGSLGGSL